MLRVAQITDTHLFADPDRHHGEVQTARSCALVLDLLRPNPPDLLLLTGDLSQDETPESYDLLARLVAPLNIPTYWIPGNHDAPDLMADRLGQFPFLHQRVIDQGGWRLILLDSTLPDQVAGVLSPDTLTALEHQLQSRRDEPPPTLIALHHPPIPPSDRWQKMGLQNPADLFAVVDQHPQVKLVLCGHIHQDFHQLRGSVSYLGTPSTCAQFDQPADLELVVNQPGLRWLELEPDGQWRTQVQRLDPSLQSSFRSVSQSKRL